MESKFKLRKQKAILEGEHKVKILNSTHSVSDKGFDLIRVTMKDLDKGSQGSFNILAESNQIDQLIDACFPLYKEEDELVCEDFIGHNVLIDVRKNKKGFLYIYRVSDI